MLRLIAPAAAAFLILAACAPPPADPASETPEAPAEVVDPAVQPESTPSAAPANEPEDFQLSYKRSGETYEVSAEIDPAILAFDAPLAWKLWVDTKAALDGLAETADADKAAADKEEAATGQNWFRGYTLDIAYRATAVLDDVISIKETYSTYTGGAHPNYALSGGVYRKGAPEPLALGTFVTDPAAFNDQVIVALVAEKIARGYEETAQASIQSEIRDMLAPSPEHPDLYKGNFVLDPSTEAGKLGGITVLFSPYDVGSYAEGSYEITLTAADLLPILTPGWAPRFGGEPAVEGEE
jgi:hypothetical protein